MTQSKSRINTFELTRGILNSRGPVRDVFAHSLSEHAPIDLVSILIGASDRLVAAEAELAEAESRLVDATSVTMSAINSGYGRNVHPCVAEIHLAAIGLVAALHDGSDSDREEARTRFVDSVSAVSAMMETGSDRIQVESLAWSAVSLAMAEETARATKYAYVTIQSAIQSRTT